MEPNENIRIPAISGEQSPAKKSSSKKVLILLGIGLGTALLGGLGYWYFSTQSPVENPPEAAKDVPEVKKPTAPKSKTPHKSGGPPKAKPAKSNSGSGSGSGGSSNLPAPVSALTSAVKDRIDIAKNIWLYCTTKKLDSVLSQLDRITNVAEYIKVNALFKTIPLKGKKQTIVTGVLSSFTDSTSKQLINTALRKIGLKYNDDSGVWSLSGIDEDIII
ncbi:MAG: hypothetical protein ACXVPQ_09565 [Bacteroidia bacterium]